MSNYLSKENFCSEDSLLMVTIYLLLHWCRFFHSNNYNYTRLYKFIHKSRGNVKGCCMAMLLTRRRLL